MVVVFDAVDIIVFHDAVDFVDGQITVVFDIAFDIDLSAIILQSVDKFDVYGGYLEYDTALVAGVYTEFMDVVIYKSAYDVAVLLFH